MKAFRVLVLIASLLLAGVLVVPSPASATTPGSPVGAFTDVSARFGDRAVLSGFAGDPSAPGQPVTVRFYVGATFKGQTTTTTVPGVSSPVFWSVESGDLGLWGPGLDSNVCAYGINVGPGENALLGCRTLRTSGNSPYNPIGSLDAVGVAPGLIQLKGWAGDPDGDDTTQLRIYYDGVLMTQRTADLPRADVQASFPAVGGTTGFNLTFPSLGTHQVCVYAQNTGVRGLQNSTIGCVTRTVPGVQPPGPHDPRGSYDGMHLLGPCCNPANQRFAARGWAFDPDTADPIAVLVRTFTDDYFMAPPNMYQTGTVSTGRPRPSVAATVPGAGPNTGFDGEVASTSFASLRFHCAYAVNVGEGASRLIGCFGSPRDTGS